MSPAGDSPRGMSSTRWTPGIHSSVQGNVICHGPEVCQEPSQQLQPWPVPLEHCLLCLAGCDYQCATAWPPGPDWKPGVSPCTAKHNSSFLPPMLAGFSQAGWFLASGSEVEKSVCLRDVINPPLLRFLIRQERLRCLVPSIRWKKTSPAGLELLS